MSFAHGGNVYEIAARMGISPDEILDFSASINPNGPPAGLLNGFVNYFHRLQHYPDIHNRTLVEAIAQFHGFSPSQVVAGNGSTELIYALPRVLGIRKALIALPAFSEYQRAFSLQGSDLEILLTTADNHFQPTVEELDAACDRARPEAVLLTHPGSPAGTVLPQAVRRWSAERSLRERIYCILDEVFVDFCEEESCKTWVKESEHLVIIRSMTKFYALPGLRLGYLLTSESIAEKVRSHLPPWSVNTYAQIAGVTCLEQKAYRAESLAFMDAERARMKGLLESLQGCRVFPGRANYLLVKLDGRLPGAARLQQDLLDSERILIRDCSSFRGLDERFVRFAIRLPEENDRLLDAFARWLRMQLTSH